MTMTVKGWKNQSISRVFGLRTQSILDEVVHLEFMAQI